MRGVAIEGPAHGQHLLLATGEGAGHLARRSLRRGNIVEDALDAVLHERALSFDRVGAHVQVLLDGQAGEDAPTLGHLDDAPRHDLVRRARASGPRRRSGTLPLRGRSRPLIGVERGASCRRRWRR